MDEQVCYQKIGQLLFDAGPQEAQKIIVRAELFPEGDGGQYEFDFYDREGRLNWFSPDAHATGDLTEILVGLRSFFVENSMCENGDFWSGCEITLDLVTMKLDVNFNYKN